MELFDEYAIRCDATIPLSEINILQCDVAQPFVIGFPRQIQEKPFHFHRGTAFQKHLDEVRSKVSQPFHELVALHQTHCFGR